MNIEKSVYSRLLCSVWNTTAHHRNPWLMAGVECVGVFGFLMFLSVVFAMGSRPVPFRTRKLSLSAPMVLHSGGCGRVGRRRHHNLKSRICTEVNTPAALRWLGCLPFFVFARILRIVETPDLDWWCLWCRVVGILRRMWWSSCVVWFQVVIVFVVRRWNWGLA